MVTYEAEEIFKKNTCLRAYDFIKIWKINFVQINVSFVPTTLNMYLKNDEIIFSEYCKIRGFYTRVQFITFSSVQPLTRIFVKILQIWSFSPDIETIASNHTLIISMILIILQYCLLSGVCRWTFGTMGLPQPISARHARLTPHHARLAFRDAPASSHHTRPDWFARMEGWFPAWSPTSAKSPGVRCQSPGHSGSL